MNLQQLLTKMFTLFKALPRAISPCQQHERYRSIEFIFINSRPYSLARRQVSCFVLLSSLKKLRLRIADAIALCKPKNAKSSEKNCQRENDGEKDGVFVNRISSNGDAGAQGTYRGISVIVSCSTKQSLYLIKIDNTTTRSYNFVRNAP